jgi:hypothetical protein
MVVLTVKWSERTAQGFSPGLALRKMRPESGVRGGWLGLTRASIDQSPTSGAAFGARLPDGLSPRVETLGCSLKPFHGSPTLSHIEAG